MNPKKYEWRYRGMIDWCEKMEDSFKIYNGRMWVRENLRAPIENLLTERKKKCVVNTLIHVANKALLNARHNTDDNCNHPNFKSNLIALAYYCIDTCEYILTE